MLHPFYHPVIKFPLEYDVLDFTKGAPERKRDGCLWSVGRYDEVRPTMYTQSQYGSGEEARTLHVGIDLGCPSGTPVYAFDDGIVLHMGNNAKDGDYGPVVLTQHVVDDDALYALHGHLAKRSLQHVQPGQRLARGDVLGWVGNEAENGGWPTHLHFQLCVARPSTHDLPGVVALSQRDAALRLYPDPRLVLGALYVD